MDGVEILNAAALLKKAIAQQEEARHALDEAYLAYRIADRSGKEAQITFSDRNCSALRADWYEKLIDARAQAAALVTALDLDPKKLRVVLT